MLVESGVPFLVDVPAMRRKLRAERVKHLRHCAGVLWDVFGDYAVIPAKVALITTGAITYAYTWYLGMKLVAITMCDCDCDTEFTAVLFLALAMGLHVPAILAADSLRSDVLHRIAVARARWPKQPYSGAPDSALKSKRVLP